MSRALLIAGGLLVGLLAALFIIPAVVDWNRYRGLFEEEASRVLGREVRVGSSVNLRLLPTPYIRFEKIRVADTQAAVGEPLFKADELTVWLAIGPLFGGAFEASQVELERPTWTLVVDGNGGGNWTSLAEAGAKAGFRPSRVALEAMRITNGTIDIRSPDGRSRQRFERINGEMSADALEGPYKISVAYAAGKLLRELKLATAAPESDGAIRFKGTVRAPESGASYSLDGRATDVFGKIAVAGQVTARVPASGPPAGDKAAAGKARATPAVFDLKAALKADTSALSLADIALSLEADGPPQLAAGSARVVWGEKPELAVELASRWLDLDRLGGSGTDGGLGPSLLRLARAFVATLPETMPARVGVKLEQATLGGDVVSGLDVAVERGADGALSLRGLSAALPGGARIDATGALNPHAEEQIYDGEVNLRGASLARFAGWADRERNIPDLRRDGPFQASGRIVLGTERAVARGLVVNYAGNRVTGDLSWAGGGRRQMVAALEGSEIDLTPFVEPGARPLAALKALAGRMTAPVQGVDGRAWPEVLLRLRCGRLLAGSAAFDDVVADVKYTGGNLSMPMLRLGSDKGWAIELNGDVAGLMQANAAGSLAALVTANTGAALADLAQMLDAPAAMVPSEPRGAALTPLRLAGRLDLGRRAPGTLGMALDGTLASSRAAGTLELGPEAKTWRERRLDVALAIDGEDAARLAAQVLPATLLPASAAGTVSGGAGRLVLRGIGSAGAGLASLIGFDAADVALEYRGRLWVDEAAALGLEGATAVTVKDLARLAGLTSLGARRAFAGVPVSGSVQTTLKGDRLTVASDGLGLGATTLSGRVEIATAATPLKVTGRVGTSEFGLPWLLAALGEGRSTAPAVSGETMPSRSIWSDDPLDLARLAGFEGQVHVDAARLVLAPGIAARRGGIDVTAGQGRLGLRLVEAEALGGKLGGSIALERMAAGAKLAGEVKLVGAQLGAPSRAAASPLAGKLSLSATFGGQALSAHGLVAALNGKGEMALAGTRIEGAAPAAVRDAAAAFLALKGEVPAGELGRRVGAALQGASLAVGDRTLGLGIADGVVQVAPLLVETPEGRTSIVTTLDLESLRYDSEWRLDAKPPQVAAGAKSPGMPAVTVVHAGPLGAIGSVEPKLGIEGLERELSVYRMEREVEELERRRREDEEMARREAERQRALEAERQKAIELEQQRLEFERRTTVEPSQPSTTAAPAAAPARPLPATPVSPPTAPVPSAMGGMAGSEAGQPSLVQPPMPAVPPARAPMRERPPPPPKSNLSDAFRPSGG